MTSTAFSLSNATRHSAETLRAARRRREVLAGLRHGVSPSELAAELRDADEQDALEDAERERDNAQAAYDGSDATADRLVRALAVYRAAYAPLRSYRDCRDE